MSCRTPFWPPSCRWLVAVLPQGNVELHFDLFFSSFLNGGWRGRGNGIVVEIHDRCFSRQNCNSSRLRATSWVFVGVMWESETPVLHLSLIAQLRHCSPSLRHVSYPAPQSSVTTRGYNVRLRNDGLPHHSGNHCVSFVARGCSQIWSSPHGYMSRLTSGLTEKTKLNVW